MLEISDGEFEKIRDIMYEHSGVFLKPTKKQLVISRLRRRLGELNLSGFEDYIKVIERPGNIELSNFINAITTNETYFFRHAVQFNVLYEDILPMLVAKKKKDACFVKIWSAACATGEEPYSLAITCQEFLRAHPGSFVWKIYASDINGEVLEYAQKGIYTERSLRETPEPIRQRYFRASNDDRGNSDRSFEIESSLKNNIEFLEHNLLEPFRHRDIDIVFLRNAMIYFDDAARARVLRHVQKVMNEGGYLFVSTSESVADVTSDFALWRAAIYQKVEN